MKDRKPKPPFDWLHFFVYFFFGAIFGAGVGLWVFTKTPLVSSPSYTPLIAFIVGGALLCGLLAGLAGDGFWRNLK